jgi:hypothetical protein
MSKHNFILTLQFYLITYLVTYFLTYIEFFSKIVYNENKNLKTCMGRSHFMQYLFVQFHSHSTPLACAVCDDSFPFSGASSIPLCYILFPATLLLLTVLPPSLPSSCHIFLALPCDLKMYSIFLV